MMMKSQTQLVALPAAGALRFLFLFEPVLTLSKDEVGVSCRATERVTCIGCDRHCSIFSRSITTPSHALLHALPEREKIKPCECVNGWRNKSY